MAFVTLARLPVNAWESFTLPTEKRASTTMSSRLTGIKSLFLWKRILQNRVCLLIACAWTLVASFALVAPASSLALTYGDFSYTSAGGSATITGCSANPCPSSLTIPSTINTYPVATIGTNAFLNKTSLTSVSIPLNVRTIGVSAFRNSGLTSVTIPNGVTSIGDFAFAGTTTLTSVSIGSNLTTLSDYLFYRSGLTSVTIPNTVTTIGYGAFASTSDLASVTFGTGLTTIGGFAFSATPLLESVTIPGNVKTIGGSAFSPLVGDAGPVGGLTSVTFGNGVETIGANAFENLVGLTTLTIPDSVTTISDYAFSFNTALASVNLGRGLQSIGISAFAASALTTITIPASVTNVGAYAFESSDSLMTVRFAGDAPTVDDLSFYGLPAGAKAVRLSSASGFGNDSTWNWLDLAQAFQLETGSAPVARGGVVKSTDIDLLPANRLFQWQRCSTLNDASSCSDIVGTGTNGAWWGTRNADIGRQVRLIASTGSTDWLTDLSGVVAPANTAAPSLNQGLVSGAPKQGTSLHTSFGTWGGYIGGSSTVSFQWQRCTTTDASSCTTNVGTNSQWYKPVAADVGNYLRVTATLTTNGQTAVASSALSSQVASNLLSRRAHTAVRSKAMKHAAKRGTAKPHKTKTHKRTHQKRR
ncbi:MAG: leucine-rich repeat domain-containing protein [Actinomycetes bacterium]